MAATTVTAKPCLTCGEPSSGTYCPGCRPADRRRDKPAVHLNPTAWKALSKRARRLQPWCLDCLGTGDLCGDHIIPVAAAPELAMVVENITVRCRPCNGRRADHYTHDDALGVLQALQATYRRHPTRGGRERISVAERVLSDLGGRPQGHGSPPVGKAKFESHIGGN